MQKILIRWDKDIIGWFKTVSIPLARIAIFIVFFWFGILKVFDLSPANPLVSNLLDQTLPFISFENFIILFGVYEMVIGYAFLFEGGERLAIALLIPHMLMTALPLALLPAVTWCGWFIPTLEGQYIIKNLVIVALAFGIAAHLHPMKKNS